MPESQVQGVLKSLAMGRNRFLYGLDHVPDDRLNWSPGGEAPSPLQLAGKTALFPGGGNSATRKRSFRADQIFPRARHFA